jgi:hypothetical protein
MNYTKLFYWLTVADNAKIFFGWFAILFTLIFIIVTLVRIFNTLEGDGSEEFYDKCNKWTWYSTPFMLLFLTLWIFTPNKRDALLIVAGGSTMNFLTQDSTVKQLPHELSSYLVTEIKNMAEETKLELNINDNKQKILDEAKQLTAEQLIERLKTDTTLKNILINGN